MSVEEKKDFSTPKPQAPSYPYGLRISLGPDELEKLGIQDAPALDQEMVFKVKAFVAEVEKTESDGDERGFKIDLQIAEMEEVKKEKSASEALYGA
jgi:hypothetical protein